MRLLLLPLIALGASPAIAKKATPPPPVCVGADDCEVKWGRAVAWVLQHNPNIAQRSNDFMATTPGLRWGEDKIQISRIPLGAGRYEITAYIECASILKCNVSKSLRSFVNHVNNQNEF